MAKLLFPFTRRVSRCTMTLLVAGSTSFSAQAFQFASDSGGLNGSLDTTISLGSAFRAQSRDPALVAITNGGTSRDINSDDGNLNFERGSPYSTALKVTHDFALKYQNFGVFARGTYFHDFTLDSKSTSTASGFTPAAKDRVDNNINLLDAFVYGNFKSFGQRNLNVRLGQQVVSWGESTFLLNGINVINPVDVSKLRIPGAELKEGLLPTPMIWASQEIADGVSLEGFYAFKRGETKLDPRGTFFSTTDALSDGADRIYIGAGRRFDQHGPASVFSPIAFSAPVFAPRTRDRDAKNSGEFGFALRSLLPSLNNTELGLFFINYHSRTPILSAVRGAASVSSAAGLGGLSPGCATSTLVNFDLLFTNPFSSSLCTGTRASYFAEYPENIRLYGLSFSTSGPGGVALQGEYSYRPNQPLQLATTEVVLAAGGLRNNITGGDAAAAGVTPGTEISGFRRVTMQQVQVTATKIFGPTLGAESLTVIGEAGYTRLSLPAGLLFAGPGVVLPALGSSVVTTAGSTQPNNEGFATKSSYGYRLAANLSYPSAFAGVTVTPRLAFSHDVHGVSPTFNQGVKAATFGVGFLYRQNWQADLSYTTFWGGRTYSGSDTPQTGTQPRTFATSANPLKDRDFISVSVSYSF